MIGNLENLLNLSQDIIHKKELKPLFVQISGVAGYLWERGWAERNAGNFSINITGFFHEKELERLSAYPFFPLSRAYPDLARTLLLMSGTGTRMRDVAHSPMENVCFVYISDSGSAYHIIHGTQEGSYVKPTSELAAHLAVQQLLLQKKAPEAVLLHAHVTEMIALTQLPMFRSEESVNSLMWGMHPETMQFLPEGTGFIPYTLPGSENIAMATLKGFEKHRVVLWEKHGCMAVGTSLADAFDNIDLLAKAARIYFQCKSAGMEPEGLSNVQLKDIRDNL